MTTPKSGTDIGASFAASRVLITGGLGFIGSTLARKLVTSGARVTVIDNLYPYYGGNRFNIEGLEDRLNVRLADIRDESEMRELTAGQNYIFALAGQTSHMDSMGDPLTDLDINCRAQLTTLEACRKSNPRAVFVYASTRQIYGRPHYMPVDEAHPLQPVDVNGINKMAGENYYLLYHQVYGMPTTVLRLTNTYGPRMRIKDARQTFLGVWIKQLLENKPFEVWGGQQLRDFTYVDDCVEALLRCAASDKSRGEVYNLGGCEVVSLHELGNLLVELNGGGHAEVREYPSDRKKIDIGNYYADYRKIERDLGWKPVVSLREGLANSLEFFRQNLAHYL